MERIQISLDKKTLERARQEAKKRGLSLAAYIRMCVLEKLGEGH